MASPDHVGLAIVIVLGLLAETALCIFKRWRGRTLAWALFSVVVISIVFGIFYSSSESIASWENEVEADFFNCVYFSVMTLTNVGYGDYQPCTSQGKALAIIEGFAGFFFLGVFVAVFCDNLNRRNNLEETTHYRG